MCGLVGAVGNIIEQDKKVIRDLLIFDTVRGLDSTGVAFYDNRAASIFVAKAAGDPFSLFNMYDCFDKKNLLINATRLVIGHNRAATIGDVNDNNAHPFMQGHIVGAHNGTLRNVNRLIDGYKFEVDSEAIFHNLKLRGPKETIPDVNGAYALTWYDDITKKMYFLRNKERPLWFSRREDKDVLFWASEKWMLDIAMGRYGIKHSEPFELPVDHLHAFDMDGWNWRNKELVDEGEILGYTPPKPVSYQSQGYTNGHRYGGYEGWWEKTFNDKKKAPDPDKDRNQTDAYVARLEKEYLNKEIEFYFENMRTAPNGVQYLAAQPVSMDAAEIRFFNMKHKNFLEWKNSVYSYKAKIKRVVRNKLANGKWDVYLIPDLRTVEEIQYTPVRDKGDSKKDGLPFKGYQGKELTEEEFNIKLGDGCAWCSANLFDLPLHKLHFVSEKDILCDDCIENEDVKSYIPMVFH